VARLLGLATHLRVVVTVLLAVIAGAASMIRDSEINPADGLLYDLALALSPYRPGTGGEPVAVVAMDETSLATQELAPLPRIFFGPLWAKVVEGLATNGAKAIGFDIIFSYSADRFPGLSNGQYDRGFLDALKRHHDKIVLARSRHTFPVAPFWVAAGPSALALAELVPDPDGIHRRAAPVLHTSDGKTLSTIAGSLLRRAGGPAMPDPMLLAPAEPLEAIPTYRLIDVLRCIDSDPAALRRAFDGKVVLIGSNLPEEDRKRTPDRFMTPPPPVQGATSGCALEPLGASDAASRTTPGMFIHAEAVKEVLTGDIVRPMAPWGRLFAAVLFAVAGAVLGFLTRPWMAVLIGIFLGGLCFAAEVALLGTGIWFPLAVPAAAGTVATVVAYLVRFVVEERRRRRVQHAFSHYLAPSIVGQLVESDAELHLGGELRQVTVMFADLSGFTSLSGRVAPQHLMELTNTYLGYIVDAVEATGGYVDKFIGDAVMGVWGAPVPNPDHAAAAARAALRAVEAVMRAKRAADARGEPGYSVKIGLNTGPAVVGNVGAPQRYNYTAIGETVNIAARLESVPEDYGCRIVVGPETAKAIERDFVLCELDWIKVKGKQEAIAIYELIAERATADADELDYARLYRSALERYRAGDFAGARDCWRGEIRHPEVAGASTSPPEIMAARCTELLSSPPLEWDGVFVKTSK
jgi:class 3 adenylate cyclase/CHASE2 domain-containing sensor protein